ncbi:ABC transporter substrate-binding protein [Eoetvoesiella caeni]|uniref:Branched-chain amino acid transport system substrate-binding protein n=1 Tax=Eoetvoesiella caeni TaxID=645616 RepID=A0A366HEC4_9BURK|nr:ABC transporter substrate-binding protein [Eoetvoesiella caeni]MCI2808648.1 ABC transporter substrate-binding protein [Eoetvoesiella caeni]NYT55189.1 ABC transporter substrate-binding protein [Eoetvoesiella caeni]RBP40830.1 branched-chain amino acid transport system substrate-binding protein [Eoetvoesiella caeni]
MKISAAIAPRHLRRLSAATLLSLGLSGVTHADITVGVILSTTGPAASLGQPAENTVKLWPGSIAGQKLKVISVNDNSDPTEAARQAAKLITENAVDVIVGPSITPPSIAAMEVAGRNSTPIIALGGGNAIIEPQEGSRKWAFKMPAPEAISVERALDHMVKNKVKTVAAIAVTTSYGEGFLKAFNAQAPAKHLQIAATERYGAQDLGVTAQVLRIMAAKPDAVYIFSFGTPAVLPQAELAKRGYKGKIYQTHGIANADFLRVGGKSVEGTYLAVAPVLVAEQLPASDSTKKQGMEYVKKYESQYGPGTRSLFGSTAWTALNWLQATVPVALRQAKPNTPEFRQALRDALENMHEVVSPEGVFNMSPGNHNGIDARGQVMVEIKDGKWKYIP